MLTTLALELLALLSRLTQAPEAPPPPPPARDPLALWAERRGFVRDASARCFMGRLAGLLACVEPGVSRASPVGLLLAVPLHVAAPVTLTATTRPRDAIERELARLFDVEHLAACLVSITLVDGAVYLTFVSHAPPPAMELAATLLAHGIARPIASRARA